jgi:hypothetical protein
MRSPLRQLRFGPALLVAACLLVWPCAAPAAPQFLEVSAASVGAPGYPDGSRYFTIDLAEVAAWLAAAPAESFDDPVPGLEVALPLPEGGSERFEIWASPVMHPELAAQYPEIRTYVGRGLDDRTATVRLDTTPAGFHALILSTRRTMLIDPVRVGNARDHVSHFKRAPADLDVESRDAFGCELVEDPEMVAEIERLVEERNNMPRLRQTGQQLRTYSTAIAATGEYTTYHGGTVALGLAAVTTSLNRVTGVYEREVSVRMQLVANNNLIIYTNGATDPYTNNNGSTMLGQNQANLDAVIGPANYDIGHVFSTGGGGIAFLGVVCVNGNKARGVTGLPAPIGDVFDIDYVAHEMGHQYGAHHSFNGTSGSCNGNRTGSSAYEPGSGSTIMSYAGICGAQNIQAHSDDYFQVRSYDQIAAFTQSGAGNGCATTTATGNLPPVPVAGYGGLTLPIGTPFILVGTVTDPDGDAVTYCWEEFDLGPAGHPDTPSGNAPIFRTFKPRLQSSRMFPRLADVRNNQHTLGELLPTYTRTLAFRLTGRDNLGGVAWDATSFAVDGNSGPFLVTSIGTTPWDAGFQRTITWDVAGTDVAPVSCSTVNIVLSTDSGSTFGPVLLSGTPNDGSAVVTVPALATLNARIKVEAAGNVFFDMNDADFEITGNATAVQLAAEEAAGLDIRPNPFDGRASISFTLDRPGRAAVDVFDAAGRRVTKLLDGERDAGAHVLSWSGRDDAGRRVASGVYFVRLRADGQTRMASVVHRE